MPWQKKGATHTIWTPTRKAGPLILSRQDLTGFSCIIYAVSCVGITFAQFYSGGRTTVNIMNNCVGISGQWMAFCGFAYWLKRDYWKALVFASWQFSYIFGNQNPIDSWQTLYTPAPVSTLHSKIPYSLSISCQICWCSPLTDCFFTPQ